MNIFTQTACLLAITISSLTPTVIASQPSHQTSRNINASNFIKPTINLNFELLASIAQTQAHLNTPAINVVELVINQHTTTRLIPQEITDYELLNARSVTGQLDDGGWFVIASGTEGTHGVLWTKTQTWEIRGNGTLNQHNQPLISITPIQGPDAECSGAFLPKPFPNHQIPEPTTFEKPTNQTPQADTPDNVRVLIVYDPLAESSVGSMNVYVAALFSSVNQAYANSQVNPLRINLAGIVEVSTPSFGSTSSQILRQLTNRYDGVADIAHDLRDAYDADLVAQLVNIPSFCGLAWLAPNYDLYGFSLSDTDCALGNLTFAHELGHNFGCSHDPDNAGAPYTPYGYGHRWNSDQWRSVMAYSPGSRVPQFSNPSVQYNGGTTGITNQRDNTRLLNLTDDLVANMRTGDGSGPDCNNNAQPDQLDIALDPSLDMDNDGQLDTCQIAADPALDCDSNGVLDSAQTDPRIFQSMGPASSFGNGVPVVFTTPPLAHPDSTVTISVSASGDLSTSGEYITLNFNNGLLIESAFISGGIDCYAPGLKTTISATPAEFQAIAAAGINLTITSSSQVDPSLCTHTSLLVTIDYTTSDLSVDANNDGILDICSAGCSADITGDGSLDFFDVSSFLLAFSNSDLRVDMNDDGILDFFDVSDFLLFYSFGCP